VLVVVDVGNTNTVFGIYRGDDLVADFRLSTDTERTADEYGAMLLPLFGRAGIDPASASAVIVSSVVPPLNTTLTRLSSEFFGRPPLYVEPGIRTGMPIRYDNPAEVGADRIVNAVAAVKRYGAPVIVLDFGTATTFDVVSARGEYLGGVIAPGLGISAEALFSRAARLARVEVREPARVIGRTTQESIQSGLFHGYVALVEGLVRRVREELGVAAPVVATGGIAPVFRESLSFLDAVDPGLTLEGLRLIWEKNRR
jgi:type III pantothenate kinase